MAAKDEEKKLRLVTTSKETRGRKRKHYVVKKAKKKAKKKKETVVNLLKSTVSMFEYLCRRNERMVLQEEEYEEKMEVPEHNCLTCKWCNGSRCIHPKIAESLGELGKPINPLVNRCFRHSDYPPDKVAEIYLAYENTMAEIASIEEPNTKTKKKKESFNQNVS